MSLRQIMREMEELAPELKAGNRARLKAAKDCALKDAPILKLDAKQLQGIYEEFFFGIATDELFKDYVKMSTKQRWSGAKILTEDIKLDFKDGSTATIPKHMTKPKSVKKAKTSVKKDEKFFLIDYDQRTGVICRPFAAAINEITATKLVNEFRKKGTSCCHISGSMYKQVTGRNADKDLTT